MRRDHGCSKTLLLALVLLGWNASCVAGDHTTRAEHEPTTVSIPSRSSPEVCESRTINYITHTLPQQCLRTTWTSSTASNGPQATDPTPSASPSSTATPSSREEASREPSAELKPSVDAGAESPQIDRPAQDDAGFQEDLATSSFMSFEEWKEMMLRKSGQDPSELRARKHREQREQREQRGDRDPAVGNGEFDSLGDDGEISLDFDALSDKVSELTASQPKGSPASAGDEPHDEQVLYDDGKTQYYRSKDAGKTCKERFSYSSFDAGATVLKTSPGAKNSKAILLENKDSYMLLECHTKNKFVIVELSDDILIDTVVLANFEFFSSMIRQFRVSVSARYPVKLDKWIDLGTFQARNSRDIQPFLVEHPQIYTKYIRIEFLTHYGNEFYCPVSLVRVHGTRMIDSWKDPEGGRDDDEIDEAIDGQPHEPVNGTDASAGPMDSSQQPANVTSQSVEQTHIIPEAGLSPLYPIFVWDPSREICPTISPTPTSQPASEASGQADGDTGGTKPAANSLPPSSTPPPNREESASPTNVEMDHSSSPSSGNPSTTSQSTRAPTKKADGGDPAGPSPSISIRQPSDKGNNTTETPAPPGPSTKVASPTQPASRNKTTTSTAQSSSASPTVQESFFKTVTKRLQLLESNTSLSLQYIEDQSRFLQEALQKMEKKQISRVDNFLDSLNKTVLTELRNVRTQYDQIWQSTVIALESQRDQSQGEILALSSRLNVLADEVVFQKRMAILQSVLLLSCLLLVIFSRGYVGSSLELALQQQRHRELPPPPPSQQHQYHHHHQSPSTDGGLSPVSPSSPSGYTEGDYLTAQHAPSQSRPSYAASPEGKLLPLTPPGEYRSRDPSDTPSSTSRARDPLAADDDFGTMTGPSDRYPEAQSTTTPSGTVEGGEDNLATDQRQVRNGGADDQRDQESPRPHLLRSTLSHPGTMRKPLPALPEDTPEDVPEDLS